MDRFLIEYGDDKLLWTCQADDVQHAREQFTNAYPEEQIKTLFTCKTVLTKADAETFWGQYTPLTKHTFEGMWWGLDNDGTIELWLNSGETIFVSSDMSFDDLKTKDFAGIEIGGFISILVLVNNTATGGICTSIQAVRTTL